MIKETTDNKCQIKPRRINNYQINAIELWRQLNAFRSNPQLLYSIISVRKNYYNKHGLLFSPFHPNKSIKTREGRQPINHFLQQLLNIKSLPSIKYNQQLNQVADTLARQFKACHVSNTPFEPNYKQLRGILNLSKKYSFPFGIKCAVGVGFSNQYEPLISLLIDDDNPQRENRRLFFEPEQNYVGIGAVALQDPSLICAVYLFTENVVQKNS